MYDRQTVVPLPGAEAAQAQRLQSIPGYDLTIIVPTFNEAENIEPMIAALHTALDGKLAWEAVFVDDNSPDGTAEIVKRAARKDPHIRCIHRLGRRGLSSACVEGVLSSAAPYVAVIDADMQHDETILPQMLETAQTEDLDVVVGSRYVDGGGIGTWSRKRAFISKLATRLATMATKVKLTDPMSGFFLVRRSTFMSVAPDLSSMGFKILLDVFATARTPLRFHEEPYEFRERARGESKLDNQAAWDFAMLLADKTIGRYIPVRFLSFAAIGGAGVFVHLLVFYALFLGLGASFTMGKVAAVIAAITSNFMLNNLITYRDKRLRGWRWFTGLASFMAVCSIGGVADIGISSYLATSAAPNSWLTAFNNVIPVMVGILAGAVWNYAVSSVYTWGDRK